ncbi:hypothetical protein F5141DRAFT_441039 [Pisolithus sp. B1]|nr:hypothetical protein F5141DRAFT_441039 [Pisolithus sp. B1]
MSNLAHVAKRICTGNMSRHAQSFQREAKRISNLVHGRDSDLQLHVLDQARGAMFETLRARRGISRKSASYGIWYPSVVRVHVVTHGVHFASMGHSISRASRVLGSTKPELAQNYKTEKHLELLPEEAIYLIEREVEETIPGAPMKVQQAYAGMIGREDMSLECPQVCSIAGIFAEMLILCSLIVH